MATGSQELLDLYKAFNTDILEKIMAVLFHKNLKDITQKLTEDGVPQAYSVAIKYVNTYMIPPNVSAKSVFKPPKWFDDLYPHIPSQSVL